VGTDRTAAGRVEQQGSRQLGEEEVSTKMNFVGKEVPKTKPLGKLKPFYAIDERIDGFTEEGESDTPDQH